MCNLSVFAKLLSVYYLFQLTLYGQYIFRTHDIVTCAKLHSKTNRHH